MVILEVLERLSRLWAVPRSATHGGLPTLFRLRCIVTPAVGSGDPGVPLPSELAELWRYVAGARLFEDSEYGQWGLVLLGPTEAAVETNKFREERQRHCDDGDLVVGRFLGDQDRLLVRCDPAAEDFGQVLVALPIYGRRDWYHVAPNLEMFLHEYERAEGAKYWEVG